MPRDRRAVIGTGIWSEPSIRQLTRLEQHAYQLAQTQPDLNRCGVIAFRPKAWANLSADGTEEQLRRDFAGLHSTRHVVLDEADELLLLRTYARHDGLLSQPLVVAAMVRDYFTITSPVIKLAFITEVRRWFELPDLEPSYLIGASLAIGADPAQYEIRNATQVGKAIGSGLAGPLIHAIRDGHVEPFTPKGLPKGLTEGLREGLTKGPPEGPPDPRPDPRENARSPVSVSTPVSVPTPVTTTAPDDPPTLPPDDDPTSALLLEHIRTYTDKPPLKVIAESRTAIQRLIAEGIHPDRIRAGLTRMRHKQLGPALLAQMVAEATPTTDPPTTSRSTTDDRVAHAQAVASRYAQAETIHPREITA